MGQWEENEKVVQYTIHYERKEAALVWGAQRGEAKERGNVRKQAEKKWRQADGGESTEEEEWESKSCMRPGHGEKELRQKEARGSGSKNRLK